MYIADNFFIYQHYFMLFWRVIKSAFLKTNSLCKSKDWENLKNLSSPHPATFSGTPPISSDISPLWRQKLAVFRF